MRASQDSRADRDKSLLKDTHDSNNQNRKTKQILAVFGEMMFSKLSQQFLNQRKHRTLRENALIFFFNTLHFRDRKSWSAMTIAKRYQDRYNSKWIISKYRDFKITSFEQPVVHLTID